MGMEMPTRVLDVGDSSTRKDGIRVFATRGAAGKYIALSYCWGGPQQLALTTQTMTQMLKEINLTALPQTLQDAVYITRKLGVRYLWVYALCIIQDSKEDMGHELKTMAQIYHNSSITISAASASGVHAGFLQPRQPKPSKHPRFKLPYRSLHDTAIQGTVMLQEYAFSNPYSELINHRAWALAAGTPPQPSASNLRDAQVAVAVPDDQIRRE